ncbi:MAG TPA: hypothetical protein VFW92_07905, partial [Candidatus Limnocylindrales bacterium]|nr:hypothetical protein [Candidatus Limnocylindrales bacterium]
MSSPDPPRTPRPAHRLPPRRTTSLRLPRAPELAPQAAEPPRPTTIEDLTGLSRSDELLLAVAIGFAGAALYIISSAAQPTPYDYFIRLA